MLRFPVSEHITSTKSLYSSIEMYVLWSRNNMTTWSCHVLIFNSWKAKIKIREIHYLKESISSPLAITVWARGVHGEILNFSSSSYHVFVAVSLSLSSWVFSCSFWKPIFFHMTYKLLQNYKKNTDIWWSERNIWDLWYLTTNNIKCRTILNCALVPWNSGKITHARVTQCLEQNL